MGRPSKFNEESIDRFFKALNAGVPPEVAARYAGFSPASMYRYLRGSTPAHAEFRVRYQQALASLEMRLAGTVLQAALTEPRWAMALLERRFPDRWSGRRIDDVGDQLPRVGPVPEAPIVLDPAHFADLVPGLLEAGRKLSGRPEVEEPDVSVFEDDGTELQPTDQEVEA